jgi:hypothetical protein
MLFYVSSMSLVMAVKILGLSIHEHSLRESIRGFTKGKTKREKNNSKTNKTEKLYSANDQRCSKPTKESEREEGGISKVELLALKCVNISRSEQRTKKRKNSSQKKKKAGQNNNNTKKNSECASTVHTRWNASNKQINKNNTQYEGNSKIVLRFRTKFR